MASPKPSNKKKVLVESTGMGAKFLSAWHGSEPAFQDPRSLKSSRRNRLKRAQARLAAGLISRNVARERWSCS